MEYCIIFNDCPGAFKKIFEKHEELTHFLKDKTNINKGKARSEITEPTIFSRQFLMFYILFVYEKSTEGQEESPLRQVCTENEKISRFFLQEFLRSLQGHPQSALQDSTFDFHPDCKGSFEQTQSNAVVDNHCVFADIVCDQINLSVQNPKPEAEKNESVNECILMCLYVENVTNVS